MLDAFLTLLIVGPVDQLSPLECGLVVLLYFLALIWHRYERVATYIAR